MLADPSLIAEPQYTLGASSYPSVQHQTRHRAPFGICILMFAYSVCFVSHAWSDEYRVSTKVFSGEKLEQQRTTLLGNDQVFDVPAFGTGFVNFLDLKSNQLVVIDEPKQRYSIVQQDEVVQFIAAQNTKLGNLPADVRSVLVPNLERAWNKETQVLELASPRFRYRTVLVQPAATELAVNYRIFVDWMARLNAFKGFPPTARLQLNQEMAGLGLLPHEIQKTVTLKTKDQLRSTHEYGLAWRAEDRSRVQQIKETYPQYRQVVIGELLR